VKRWRIALLCVVLSSSCASAPFPYTSYGLDFVGKEPADAGRLLAHDPKDDLGLSQCEPVADASGKRKFHCVVLFDGEYYKLRAAYQKLETDLDACQASLHAAEIRAR
jgi:hypothetical protein